jgi:hypothetical protein
MAENEIATALELMQGGLKFKHDRGGWYWTSHGEPTEFRFLSELDAVSNFCCWYAQTRVVKDAPQPAAFDLDAFMMDGIQALTLAAAEEMRARGQEFDAEVIAGELVRTWHMIAAIKCGLPW